MYNPRRKSKTTVCNREQNTTLKLLKTVNDMHVNVSHGKTF